MPGKNLDGPPAAAAGRGLRAGLLGATALLCAGTAKAATTISTSVATPLATSTASNGSPDNLEVTSSGAVQPATAGAIVTLDSDNTVLNSGVLKVQGLNDSAGVLVQGGHTGSVSNAGTIEVDEVVTSTDADGDGDLDGPFVTGARRYGVRIVGTAPFTGAISNQTAGVITVSGDDSAGISLETGLLGSIIHAGTMSVTGSRTYGIHVAGTVSGDVSVLGGVSALGQGATAVAVDQDVAGQLALQGTITATGYRYTTRGTATAVSKLDPDDLLQGGPAVSVAASLGRGLLVDTPPTLDANNPDVDGDGWADASETVGTIISYGAAPAIVVGAAGRNVALGEVGAGVDAYGVVIRGLVTGTGVYDGVASTGLQFGVAGGGAVDVAGGVRVTGTVSGLAAQADTTAIVFKSGASAPVLRNEGTISASVTAMGAATARAVSLEAGAHVPLLQNGTVVSATVVGAAGDAIAIQDRSGALTDIENAGQITAKVAPAATATSDPTTENVTGRAIAIDLSGNAAGATLRQFGTVGVIGGDVLLGSGADDVQILGGTLTGALSLGAGANSLTIDGGAGVKGALTASGGTLALAIGSGALQMDNVGTVNLTSLSVASGGALTLTADPVSGSATRLEVAGAATLAAGAKIGVRLNSILLGEASYTLIHAQSLSAGALDTSLLGSIPFLYTASLATDQAAGTISVTLSRKTAAQLQLGANAAAIYGPAILAANADAGVRDGVLAQTDQAGLTALLSQMAPNHSGAIFETLGAQSEALARAIDERQSAPAGGAWAQETDVGLYGDAAGGDPGYRVWGVGLAGGYERGLGGAGVVGVSLGLNTNQLSDNHAQGDENMTLNLVEGGVYWRAAWRGLAFSARAAGDYAHMDSRRVVAVYDASGNRLLFRTAQANWSGFGGSARVKVSYEVPFGRYYVRPTLSADYLLLHEQGYSESGGGPAIDLTVDARDSDRASGFAGVAFGASFGQGGASWGPELQLGYHDVVSGGPASTTARFAGGSAFTLAPNDGVGGGPAARISLKGENGVGGIAVEAGAEKRGGLQIYDLRLAAHYMF
ncbi:autotransporter outer membrane beta-barrel domain-containing protein [Phenylobacterium sp.]|uniref:autotransporter family protein n=1 Tax=Phenylobacterium sp. TaxID=1871053 RepID=UPI002F3EE078